MKTENKRDKQQKELWKSVISWILVQEQREEDALQIDKDRKEAAAINAEKYKWLLDNFQLNRPSRKTHSRRVPINIFNTKG